MAGTRPAMTIRGKGTSGARDRMPTVFVSYQAQYPNIVMAGLVPAIHGFLRLDNVSHRSIAYRVGLLPLPVSSPSAVIGLLTL
jgi:hypothetical protein